jgi:hypothetical protein
MFFSKFIPEKHLKYKFISTENYSENILSFISEYPVTANTIYKNKNTSTGGVSYYKFSLKRNKEEKFILDCNKFRNFSEVVRYIPRGANPGRCYLCNREKLLHSVKHINHSYSEPKKEILEIRSILVPDFLRKDEIEFLNLEESDNIMFVNFPDTIDDNEQINDIEFLYEDKNILIYNSCNEVYPCYHYVKINSKKNTGFFTRTQDEIQEWSIFDISKYFLKNNILIPSHFYKYVSNDSLVKRSKIDLSIPYQSFIDRVNTGWYKTGCKEEICKKTEYKGEYEKDSDSSESESESDLEDSDEEQNKSQEIEMKKDDNEKENIQDIDIFNFRDSTKFENIILVMLGIIIFFGYTTAVILKFI